MTQPVLFFDPLCQKPYSTRTRQRTAQGGTEATVSRVADALDAPVMQHNRTEADGRYLPPASAPGVEHLVIVRDPRRVRELHERYPGARLYVWMHDLILPGEKWGRRLAMSADAIRDLDVTIVCVSDSQRRGIEAVMRSTGSGRPCKMATIYNAIDDALVPDGSAVDPTKLVFFSSPNKGLAYTLDAFRILRKSMPELRLYIGNPGYKELRMGRPENVEWLGALPSAKMIEEVRSAFCVFYLNFVLAETFGLVLAEANAVGTPVLTHDCGAVSEVLADARQILPVTPGQRLYERLARGVPPGGRRWSAELAAKLGIFDAYIKRMRAWRDGGRPQPKPDGRFRLSVVAERWRALFEGRLDARVGVHDVSAPLTTA